VPLETLTADYLENSYQLGVSGDTVEIVNGAGTLLFVLYPEPKETRTSRADRVLEDTRGKQLLRFQRMSRHPHARFRMVRDGQECGTIACKALLRTSYEIAFPDSLWLFKQPLFTVWFRGDARGGGAFHARMLTVYHWGVLFDPGRASTELLGTLAMLLWWHSHS
jgi:hypothetical protein